MRRRERVGKCFAYTVATEGREDSRIEVAAADSSSASCCVSSALAASRAKPPHVQAVTAHNPRNLLQGMFVSHKRNLYRHGAGHKRYKYRKPYCTIRCFRKQRSFKRDVSCL